MRKFIKNNIFGFILGIILCSGIVYGVNTYESNTIEYNPTDTSWNVSNVNEAINSLYSMKTELDNTKTSLNNLKGIGDATAAQILSGKKALVKGSTITGTMTNRGAWTNTPTGSGNVTIPAGYHNGSGYVNTATVYTNGYNAGLSSSSTIELIWTNPSPSSDFASQKIALTLKSDDLIFILSKHSKSGTPYNNVLVYGKPGQTVKLVGMVDPFQNWWGSRDATISTTGIAFGSGSYYGPANGSGDGYGVPLKIYRLSKGIITG